MISAVINLQVSRYYLYYFLQVVTWLEVFRTPTLLPSWFSLCCLLSFSPLCFVSWSFCLESFSSLFFSFLGVRFRIALLWFSLMFASSLWSGMELACLLISVVLYYCYGSSIRLLAIGSQPSVWKPIAEMLLRCLTGTVVCDIVQKDGIFLIDYVL